MTPVPTPRNHADEAALERELGLLGAVRELGRPAGEETDIVTEDAWLLRSSAPTRRRKAAVHLAASAVLREQYCQAAAEFDGLGEVGLVLAAVRATVFAGRLITPAIRADRFVQQALAENAAEAAEALLAQSGRGLGRAALAAGAADGRALVAELLFGPPGQGAPLRRICAAASADQAHRYGVAAAAATLYAGLLLIQDEQGRTARELSLEQAALALAYTEGGYVRWSEGRLSLH
ncbi:hypothetical protein ABT095_30000 [Kitasatospora sp. NPDC002227]|uniref:hypothetical protein n=1 Tax=Kitasatospora sp. NPDC002227 TaxID=3154773 RepID=UPI003316D2EB